MNRFDYNYPDQYNLFGFRGCEKIGHLLPLIVGLAVGNQKCCYRKHHYYPPYYPCYCYNSPYCYYHGNPYYQAIKPFPYY